MMKAISEELKRARAYEALEGSRVTEQERPVFHFSPRIGWLNDPNGLSYYDGQYHLFYQYHPFNTYWGPMHWGHAVSSDLIRWEYLPAVLAPDTGYDRYGCFSGTAVTMDDGSHLLMYTGCTDVPEDPTGKGRWLQSQNLAVKYPGESEYVKYGHNPVITADDLPEDGDPYEFRDPYLWRAADGSYRALVANGRNELTADDENTDDPRGTQLTLYRSADGFKWERGHVLFEDRRKIGVMWECPNFFRLDDRYVLIASPMDMQAEEEDAVGSIRFPKGNNVCAITGEFDIETEEFTPNVDQMKRFIYEPVDRGLDFYAPQVMETPDGRHVMIGWMQDPHTSNLHDDDKYNIFGQMTVPRELSIRDGRLHQWPVRELEAYRKNMITGSALTIGDEWNQIPGIDGRQVDLQIDIDASGCEGFMIRFAAAGLAGAEEAGSRALFTELRYDPKWSTLTIDRRKSGQSVAMTAVRTTRVRERDGRISLRILIDRWSVEIFINGGEQVMSATFFTDPAAQDIAFRAEGKAVMDIIKYTISKEKGEQ